MAADLPPPLKSVRERLMGYCTDWDGSNMADQGEPRIIPTCGELREAASIIAAQAAEVEALRADAEWWRWIEENATSYGGGKGFTLTVFVPHDIEDWGCAIDAARAALKEQTP